MKKINIHINGKSYEAKDGESVLQVAIRNGIEIPHFCYHEDLPVGASCRTCLVETEDGKIHTSCTIKVGTENLQPLQVYTNTPKVDRLRRENMELLLAGHQEHCPKCLKGLHCDTAEIMKKYKVTGKKYQRDWTGRPVHLLGTAAEIDPRLCIACNKCVEICEKIGVCNLHIDGHDSHTRVSHNLDPEVDCVYCGQCTSHCPTGAAREQSHLEAVETVLADPEKIVIVQAAPSIRASLGDAFGIPHGEDVSGKMFTAFRKLGFDKVFDVNMGADITTIVEAEELVERIKNKGILPMYTSCCPGWVKCVEFYYPELIPHLTTSRSPQIHAGALYKTWWAEREGLDPKKVVVVSIMPCTSKKYESNHEKFNIDGMKPVDYVLTTRELANLLRKQHIDLQKLEPSEVDREGMYSGAAAIYGASGGVMESALRTGYKMITGKDLENLDIKPVRGMKGVKKAEIKIDDQTIRVGVVTTPKNVKKVLKELEADPEAYHYIEVMMCPGGCIGGGGQPLPNTEKIIQKRIAGLYGIDKKMKMRLAHENPVVQEVFEYVKKLPEEKQHALLHTHYEKKAKYE